MSYALLAALVAGVNANAAAVALIANDADGAGKAIYPYHHNSIKNPAYPLVTIAQFGEGPNSGRFGDSDFAGLMDEPKIAVCVWSQLNIDEAHKIYDLIDSMLNGKSTSSEYVSTYRMRRTQLRSDLFDKDVNAYHLHSEWIVWESLAVGHPIPISI